VPGGERANTVPAGRAQAVRPVPVTTEGYPNDFHWDEATETLHVGEGTFAPVSRAVWEFEVSGLRPVKSWLGYRMREPAGRKSSPLDEHLTSGYISDNNIAVSRNNIARFSQGHGTRGVKSGRSEKDLPLFYYSRQSGGVGRIENRRSTC